MTAADASTPSPLRGPWAVFFLLLLLLAPLRLSSLAGPGPYGVDASYFHQIARHVSEGDGLRTRVSVYHEGIQRFPAPTRVYPLWPLLLGHSGRALGLHNATQILPPLFWFLDLVLLYAFARVLERAMFGEEGFRIGGSRWPLDAGHLSVIAFAANPSFFAATTHPYTEGPAFALAFVSLLCLARAETTNRFPWSLACGVSAGLAFLARSQMVCLIAGIGLTLLAVALRQRAWRLPVLLFGLGAVAAIAPWYVYLGTVFPAAALNPFAGINPFFEYRETPEIAPFVAWVPTSGLGEWLRDRLPGIAIAFHPRHHESYFATFGAAAALVPLAALRLVVPRSFGSGKAGVHRSVLLGATVASGVIFFVVLLQFHATFFLRWLFGWRHGLPLILLLVPAIAYLVRDGLPFLRFGTVVLVLLSAAAGLLTITKLRPVPWTEGQRQLAAWVDQQQPLPVILSPHATSFGVMTRGFYHWTLCTEPPEQTRRMLQHLPIDYVVVSEAELRCPFLSGLQDALEVKRVFGPPDDRWLLFAPKSRAPS